MIGLFTFDCIILISGIFPLFPGGEYILCVIDLVSFFLLWIVLG